MLTRRAALSLGGTRSLAGVSGAVIHLVAVGDRVFVATSLGHVVALA